LNGVKTQVIHQQEAKMWLLAGRSGHEQIVKRLTSRKDSVLAKIEHLAAHWGCSVSTVKTRLRQAPATE